MEVGAAPKVTWPAYAEAAPVMDRYAARGLIHQNKAARHKSRMTAHIRALG